MLGPCARFVREHARQIGKVIVDLRFAEPHPDLRVRRRPCRSGTRPGLDHRTILLAQSLPRPVACLGARWRPVGPASLIRRSVSRRSQIAAHRVLVLSRAKPRAIDSTTWQVTTPEFVSPFSSHSEPRRRQAREVGRSSSDATKRSSTPRPAHP
jgi:hypothetical protein